MTGSRGRVRDRDVFMVLALVVLAVLGVELASAVVPGVDAVLAGAPVLVVVLVAGTLVVLAGTLVRGRRPRADEPMGEGTVERR